MKKRLKFAVSLVAAVLFWTVLIAGLVFAMGHHAPGPSSSRCESSWQRHVQVSSQDGMPAGDHDLFVEKCNNFDSAIQEGK